MLAEAVSDIRAMAELLEMHFTESHQQREEIYKAGLASVPFLYALGDVIIAWLLLRQAEVANTALEAGRAGQDGDFYRGKIASARFFTRSVLPGISATLAYITRIDGDVMDLPEAGF